MQPFQQTPPSWGRIEGPSTRFSPSPSSTTGDVGSLSSGQFRGRLLGDATIDTRGRFPLGEDHSRSSADITQQFKYNTRISMALLPSLAIVAVYGGSSVAACLVVGFIGAYCLDGLRIREGAFLAVWGTLAASHLSLAYSMLVLGNHSELGLVLGLFMVMLGGVILFLTGAWASLQFVWIQTQYPTVAFALENTLISSLMPASATVLTWGIAEATGMHTAPFYQAILLCVLYAVLCRPLRPSSLSKRSQGSRNKGEETTPQSHAMTPSPEINRSSLSYSGKSMLPDSERNRVDVLQTNFEGFLSFALVCVLPTMTYVATHFEDLTHWVHVWSVFLLFCGPLLFLSVLENGIWWLGSGAGVETLRNILILLSLGGFLAGIEGRLVFHSFGQYVRLAPPWSYVAITIGMYAVGALILLLLTGALGEGLAELLIGPILMIGASILALVIGMPVWVLPAPLISAAGLALFYETRSFRDYFLFLLGAMLSAGWFFWQHFWFLKDISIDGMPLRSFCVVLFAATFPGLLAPGLALSGARGNLLEASLIAQAFLIMFAEEKLYAGDHLELTYNIHSMYPAALVVFTSTVGVLMARRLKGIHFIRGFTAYAMQCVYGAKIVMLAVPDMRLTLPMVGFALAISPPLLLHEDERKRIAGHTSGSHRGIHPMLGFAMFCCIIGAVVASRYSIFDILTMILNRNPSEALALGSLLIISGLGTIPLVARYYSSSISIRRGLFLTISLGVLLSFFRPPLPIRGGSRCPHLPFGLCPRLWNEEHVPEHEVDDVVVYGDGLRRKEHWPLWLLVGALFAGLVAATSPTPVRQVAPLRLAQAAAGGALVGWYMALEFFRGMLFVQILICVSTVLTAASVLLIQMPTRGGAVLVPLIGLLWIAVFPASLIAQTWSALPPLPAEAHRLLPDLSEGLELEEERRDAVKAAVMAIYAAESLLLAFSLKLRISFVLTSKASRLPAAGRPGGFTSNTNYGDESYIDKAADIISQHVPSLVKDSRTSKVATWRGTKLGGSSQHQLLAEEGLEWAPVACNFTTIASFLLCLLLNSEFMDGEPLAIPVLTSILLLLCEDEMLFKGLHEHRRYFPPVVVGGILLSIKATLDIVDDVIWEEFLIVQSTFSILINSLVLLGSIVSATKLALFLWWRRPTSRLFLAGPALMSALYAQVFLEDSETVRILSWCSLGGTLYVALRMRSLVRFSRKRV